METNDALTPTILVKFLRKFQFCQTYRKISFLVKIFGNLDFGLNFLKISILVKIL